MERQLLIGFAIINALYSNQWSFPITAFFSLFDSDATTDAARYRYLCIPLGIPGNNQQIILLNIRIVPSCFDQKLTTALTCVVSFDGQYATGITCTFA